VGYRLRRPKLTPVSLILMSRVYETVGHPALCLSVPSTAATLIDICSRPAMQQVTALSSKCGWGLVYSHGMWTNRHSIYLPL